MADMTWRPLLNGVMRGKGAAASLGLTRLGLSWPGSGSRGREARWGLFGRRKCPHGDHNADGVQERPGVGIGIRAGLRRFNNSLSGLWQFDSRIRRRSIAVTYGFNGSFCPANPVDEFFGFRLFDPRTVNAQERISWTHIDV